MSSTNSNLQPLAFFWDIENCQVPVTKSAQTVVQKLREKFGSRLAEVEFIVVCDVMKERPEVVEDLNAAQVTLIHINSLAKNACDDKLRTEMSKFSMVYKAPGVVVLISSDVNFTHSLTDLRYRCGFRTILVHNEQVSNTLLLAANERYNWHCEIISQIGDRTPPIQKTGSKYHKVLVNNLPEKDGFKIRDRLKQLSDNCGGRVLEFDATSKSAVLGFTTVDSATRAQKRIDGADVFGKRISVGATDRGNVDEVSRGPSTSSSPSIQYVGRSAIVQHFEPVRAETEGDSVECGNASQNGEEESGYQEEADIEEITEDNGGMDVMRGHCAESARLKQVLGMNNRNGVFNNTTNDDDDYLDFTRVKNTNRMGGIGEVTVTPEKQPHVPSSKLRVLERFARESVELLRASPQCCIQLRHYSSSWIKHFNRPLRLGDFGCFRLIDLLEEVGDTLQVITARNGKDKLVTLTPPLLWSSLQDQIVSILRQQPFRRAPVDNLLQCYKATFGYPLNLRMFGFGSIEEVIYSMQGVVEIEPTDNGIYVAKLVEQRHRQMLANQLLYMFIRCPERRLAAWQLENEFRAEFGIDVSVEDVKNYLSEYARVTQYDASTVYIELQPIHRLALRLRRILVTSGGELPLTELDQLYYKHYGERIEYCDRSGETKSVIGVLRMASHVLYLKGRGLGNCTVCINRNFLSSLKDLKPDLFIPTDSHKAKKKKAFGQPARSTSVPRSHGLDRGGKMSSWKQSSMGDESARTISGDGYIPMPISKKSVNEPSFGARRFREESISAASTPPDSSGLEDNCTHFYTPQSPSDDVVISGLGALPNSKSPSIRFSSSSVLSIQSGILMETARDIDTEPASTPTSKLCRKRLAANFGALAKLE